MGNIVLLDDLTINKIAAGEVIERPASVVKEMVENSIDAGADKITVEIKNGGISFIRISDNGKGIAPDDMEIAFERHATSKIRQAEDITKVMSMGFRGEALASIAAVANVEMISRKEDSDIGNRIVVEGGRTIEQGEVGSPIGTTITVRNLFYNTPVRYKFLKKDFTESGYIEDVVTRLALVNKNISFKLINSGKTILQTSGTGSNKDVVFNIYGKDIANSVLDVDYEYEGIKVTGVVGKPEIARGNRSHQLFFVNKRYIKDKTLNAATEQAFKGMIPINKYGFLILNVEMNPELVDVNVHPAKLEVRFEEENKVFKAVYHAIKEALSSGELVESVAKEEEEKKNVVQDKPMDQNLIEEIYKFREGLKEIGVATAPSEGMQISDIIKEKEEKEQKENNQVPSDEQVDNMTEELLKQRETREILDEAIKNTTGGETDKTEEKVDFNDMYNDFFGRSGVKEDESEYIPLDDENMAKINEIREAVKGNKNIQMIEKPETAISEIPGNKEIISLEQTTNETIDEFKNMKNNNYKFIGIVFDTYIVVQIENEMYIIDQHAAHERIRYETVKRNYFSDVNKDCQMMLLPDVITLTHKEVETIKENVDMFEKAGFDLEAFGENTIKLNGVPSFCIDLNTKQLFIELLDEVGEFSRTARQEKEDHFLATIACKSAVKAKMKLGREEVEALMSELLELPNPFTCPHGRPTAIKMSKYELEKNFRRIM
ncbi:MAG: DNA mismatch repair endonuclease MutL [Clostridia bacterium]|nr:DNA mismatch repair endonuclease MutL [Clostridia bacterium]